MLKTLRNLIDPTERELRRLQSTVDIINKLEPEMQALSDTQLRARTDEFRTRLSQGESLDDLLPEAFAVVREASCRTLKMRHFDVQLLGGIVLHQGRIAEMKTGEGKTLAATLPVYLNALSGKGVHVVTVNDYLARRDAEWMGEIYQFLGLSVGVIVHGLSFEERKAAYSADVTYGTNNEFGFDYLRDNMVVYPEQIVQRELNYAIVDEVDSILIDEARTPLIISGAAEDSARHYQRFAQIVPQLKPERDYTVDEKAKTIAMTDEGLRRVEKLLNIEDLFDEVNFELNHYLNQALKAKEFFARDRDYIVKDGEVIIVDEFTGRLMPGRRYSDGLHQSIEAKEGVAVLKESQTLATITFQNYFRMYNKLAGMTGTAKTEEEEFRKIYGLDVVVIPTNKPMIRTDLPDAVYRTKRAKNQAILDDITERHAKGQPVLVGTISIEASEYVSDQLKRRGIPHQVLNAKYHDQEAEIVKLAGQLNTVTIATNMAGRGTDIVLGEGVLELGGLHIIGTERHESRRIDNQLRGRAGRQGDPGSSQFYVSLEDDLMRLFGSERIMGLMERLGWEEHQVIDHPQISKAIENAQKKVENRHFEIRRQVLEYDNVMNEQREVIYAQRRAVLLNEDITAHIQNMFEPLFERLAAHYANENMEKGQWDLEGLRQQYREIVGQDCPRSLEELVKLDPKGIASALAEDAWSAYERRTAEYGPEIQRHIEKIVLLQITDQRWMDHLSLMDDLREGIGLRAYGQRDPLLEYRLEAYEMFQSMVEAIQEDCIRMLFKVRLASAESTQPKDRLADAQFSGGEGEVERTPRRTGEKVGRNDPCPCGSGKKYKRCCGR
ncbi:MAG: preprotein translocase subunit SecA [Firmicutes bacterium]|jgi:preprotein translocase subunit SecA|nr:preprotein translocase subunit SecA [Bacillota bacterium]NLO66773.1 preprotein translocase subunit SecA [Bacillota bacterium]